MMEKYDVILVDFDGTLYDTIAIYNKFWERQSVWKPDFQYKSTIQILTAARHNCSGAAAAMNHLKYELYRAPPIMPVVDVFRENASKCFVFTDSMTDNMVWTFYGRNALRGLPPRYLACDSFCVDGGVKWHEHKLKRDAWRWDLVDELLAPKKALLVDDSEWNRNYALARGFDVMDPTTMIINHHSV